MAMCNCMGGNPCPCQMRRMMFLGWSPPYTPPVYPYQPIGPVTVYSAPMVWRDERVPAMRADEV